MKRLLIIVFLTSGICSSCSRSATWHLQKAKEKCPECFETKTKTETDTTTIIKYDSSEIELNADMIVDPLDTNLQSIDVTTTTGDFNTGIKKLENKTSYKYNPKTKKGEINTKCKEFNVLPLKTLVIRINTVIQETITIKPSFWEGLIKYLWLFVLGMVISVSILWANR